MTTSIITIYTLTSFVGGYSSGSYYKLHKGKHWKLTFIMTLCLFPAIGLIIGLVLNFLAVGYASSASIPWWAFLQIFSLFFFAVAPLTLAGTLYARRRTISGDFPCRVTSLPRPIFHRKWFTAPYFLAVAGGILPFGSIFIEMYFIFTSFWNYKFYYVYGFMLLVFVILLCVTMCVTIISIYFLLNAEDYRWQWTAFGCGASTALYVFLYASYYYYHKTAMTGVFQAVYYFGYCFIFCTILGIICGAVSFSASQLFVRRIYHNIKSD